MSLKEHEDNRFTKEKTEVERYLMRIIQRYFDIENNFTQESIEAMIIESLTRFKQIIVSQKGFIFSLNKMTGHLTLTIRDFGGEPAFTKNTAFNKDFGTKADTICEGNDPRLFDEREPLYHVHEIADVKGLAEELAKIGVPKGLHIHGNKSVLDMLRYTGKQTQIDLIVIEQLQKAMNEYYANLQGYKRELTSAQKKALEDLDVYMPQLELMLENIQSLVNEAITWLQEAYDYTDSSVSIYKAKVLQMLLKYITKEQAQPIIDYFKKPYYLIVDGEIPITNGDITFVPVEEITEAGSGQGDSLKQIYDEGLRLGNDDWIWNETDQSFVYQHNEEGSYPMFASLSKFTSYTHRVTLASDGGDNDCISVVIAYNENTGDHLSIVVGNGGANASGQTGATVNIVYNFTGNYHMIGDSLIGTAQIHDTGQNWKEMDIGVTILVKKEENNIKVWALYDVAHNWLPEERDGVKSIYPTETPIFDFNLTDYPELSTFVDRKNNYGYGCFSQPQATYKDVYFISAYAEPYGHTNITESKTTQYTVPAATMAKVNNGKMKLFFRYEKDGETINTPLPFHFKDENDNDTVIQGAYTEAGNILITSNFLNQVQLLADADNLYDSETIIVASCAIPDALLNIKTFLESEDCTLCLVNSAAKNNFVKNLLLQNKEYYIQGYNFSPDGPTYYADDMTPLTYTDWDTGEPNAAGLSSNIKYNTNKKWADADGSTEKIGYVAEYKIKRLTQYFDNPRIYYQVFGNKEVV